MKIIKKIGIHNGIEYTGEEFLKDELRSGKFQAMAQLGIYKKDFLLSNELWFKKGILHEDEEFTRKLRISPEEVAQKLKSMSEKYGDLRVQEKIDEIQEKFKHIKRKTFVHRRLLNAFPNMRSAGSQRRDMHFQYIKKILKEKR